MKLVFRKKSDEDLEAILARSRYQRYWDEHEHAIKESLYRHTGLRFRQKVITVHVWKQRNSRAGIWGVPMQLTQYFSEEDTGAILIHELAHRLLIGHRIWPRSNRNLVYVFHAQIDLFLYDVLKDVHDVAYADRVVKTEKTYSSAYRKAWERALAKTYAERQSSIQQMIGRYRRLFAARHKSANS